MESYAVRNVLILKGLQAFVGLGISYKALNMSEFYFQNSAVMSLLFLPLLFFVRCHN